MGLDATRSKKRIEVGDVETDVSADLVERHPSLGNQSADEPLGSPEVLGGLQNVKKLSRARHRRRSPP